MDGIRQISGGLQTCIAGVFFSYEVRQGTVEIFHTGLWGFPEALDSGLAVFMTNPVVQNFQLA